MSDIENNIEEEIEYIELEFDDGTKEKCSVLGIFDCEGQTYIALDPENGTDEIYIYGYEDVSDAEYELRDIDDDEFEAAAAEFDRLLREME